jgi:hypothetical protein
MLPWKPAAQILADYLGTDLGMIGEASDRRIIDVLGEHGFTRGAMVAGIPELQLVPEESRDALLDAIGFEAWFVENVRRGARDEDPLPFGSYVGGIFIDTSHQDFPTVWVVATPASDPDALAKTFVRKCRQTFGKQAFRAVYQFAVHGKPHLYTPEQMSAMHERGLSYKEIAIQSLREVHQGIVESPEQFKPEIETERTRIVKSISAARKLWNLRRPEDSIG